MRSEKEIRFELELVKARFEHCRSHGIKDDELYYEGYLNALKWVLGIDKRGA